MPYWRLYYHLVWGTKNRHPTIDVAREDIVRRSIRATWEEHGALVHGIGVMPDHVHLAVSIPPRIAVAEFVQWLKGSSSHLINRIETMSAEITFAWQAEYGAVSFGERSLEDVVAYVENQHAHHADQSLRPTFEILEHPYDPTNRPRH
jgi:putative transposase